MSSACVGRFVSPDKMGITASKEEPRDHRSREGLAIGPQESQSSQGIDITASGIITMYNISLHNISHLCDTQHCDTQQNCVDVDVNQVRTNQVRLCWKVRGMYPCVFDQNS